MGFSGGASSGGSSSAGGSGKTFVVCPEAGEIFKELTDPTCVDGQYCETLPDHEADIGAWVSTLKKSGDPDVLLPAALGMLDAAWPFGASILRIDEICAKQFLAYPFGWQDRVGTAVHECGHLWDNFNGYHLSSENTMQWLPNDYFERWEITQDDYSELIPDAPAFDPYFNKAEASSHQGIQTMYDEWAQYVHSSALDYLTYADSPRDYYVQYMLNFAWNAQRYFAWAEKNHPSDFEDMMASPKVREATLALWGQTFLYYDAYISNLGWTPAKSETRFLDAIRTPELLEMMNRIRIAHGCQGI